MRIAAVAVCLVLVAMSPAAMDAFSQITGATILSGTMDLGESEASISAVGVSQGLIWDIECEWIAGRPKCLVFKNPRTSL
jgi:hypothetical protein